jgi:hypothetical protein
VFVVMYTGDTGQMLAPTKISGSPLSAETSADTSVVTVDMRYESGKQHAGTDAPPPPSKATIRVLTVKRVGSWWVATPNAFNPLTALGGGLDEAELRELHEKLLAAP